MRAGPERHESSHVCSVHVTGQAADWGVIQARRLVHAHAEARPAVQVVLPAALRLPTCNRALAKLRYTLLQFTQEVWVLG